MCVHLVILLESLVLIGNTLLAPPYFSHLTLFLHGKPKPPFNLAGQYMTRQSAASEYAIMQAVCRNDITCFFMWILHIPIHDPALHWRYPYLPLPRGAYAVSSAKERT
ncbi:uncharacterized protein GGS22DRAFT_83066 [Annulohypoxylon maeteangense]|uniref:uncharacterized protein n=1 Tax=Annulohypoxylon maeteangense TaxID=1927788 RepID=UPI002007EBE8|nr:uncharacterized protein GGS22DRAFT_83066 [Annulohypoxylon maeteangense]KAI0880566.1 hypothetical protein GGS22DRAFT_83066 [Annulohypoxylon maeteangense]